MAREIKVTSTSGRVIIEYSHAGGNWRWLRSETTKISSSAWDHISTFQEQAHGRFPDPLVHGPLDDLGQTLSHGNQVVTTFGAVYLNAQGQPSGSNPPSKPVNTTKPGGGGGLD